MSQAVDPFGIVGQVLDSQFRVDRLVGEGGFSAVYRGHHLGLDEPIAIKCLKLPPALSTQLVDEFAKRFRDESRILYRLSQGNLNIVRSIAAGTWQANTGAVVPYMILEWMEGRSLLNEFTIRRTVGQQGRPLVEIVKMFASAADGLSFAHSQGVVHRDLNPGNFFLAGSSSGMRIKVLDFGVAKILDDSTLNIARTQTVGSIRIFAPAYGAPEQFDDAIGKVGAATDVYAFALILLEALRDRSVNDGQHLGEFAQKAIDPDLRPTPRSLGLDVTDEVEQVFVKATRLDPRERWQSAGELWQALAIAASAASQQKHAQAAKETPSLAMPQVPRSTKAGMAPPAQQSQQAPQAQKMPGTARMEKTLPIGAVFPNNLTPRPAAGAPPDTLPPSNNDEPEDVPTRVGARLVAPPMPMPIDREPEDEVTRVRAPEPDMLRGLGDGRGAAMTAPPRVVSPPGAPVPAAGNPPIPEPPPSGETLLVASGANPAAFGAGGPISTHPMHAVPQHQQQQQQEPRRHPSGQLAQTMPLMGPHPLGLPTQQGSGSPLPAAGAPSRPHQQQHPNVQAQPPQNQLQPQHPQHPHAPPPQQQQQQQQQRAMQHSMQGGPPQHAPNMYGQQQAHASSVSMAPSSVAGVPKKSNPIVFIAIGAGVLAVAGLGLIAVALHDKGGAKGASSASTSVSAPASITASAPPPLPRTPTTEPAPTAAVAADASDTPEATESADAGNAEATPAASATATATTPPAPTTPTPAPTQNWTPPTPVAVKDAGPPVDPNAWNELAARSKLNQANGVLAFCKKPGGPAGPGSAIVTFAPEGIVSMVIMNPPYANTPVGDCVAGQIKRTKINPYKGGQQSLKHTFDVPR